MKEYGQQNSIFINIDNDGGGIYYCKNIYNIIKS